MNVISQPESCGFWQFNHLLLFNTLPQITLTSFLYLKKTVLMVYVNIPGSPFSVSKKKVFNLTL